MLWLLEFRALLLVSSLFLFEVGEANVKCYLCSTKKNEIECRYPESYNMPLMHCDINILNETRNLAKDIATEYDKIYEVDTAELSRNIDLDCLKVVTKYGNRDYIIRGCQLAEQSSKDICYKTKKNNKDYLTLSHCSRCSRDGCNSSPVTFKINYIKIFAFLVLLPFNV